jgi:hypothetical protein
MLSMNRTIPGWLLGLTLGLTLEAAAPTAPQGPPKPAADPHAQMVTRGAQVMGFDQEKTTHHFLLFADGGAIDVSANDKNDGREEMMATRDAIREHLPHIARMFGDGDFSNPMLIHGSNVPGTKELAALKARVKYVYMDTQRGGRVDITTTDPAALAALHTFLRFQIADHKTGDSGKVEKR